MERSHYEDRPDPRQMAVFASMSLERKLQVMTELRTGAMALKRAYLRSTQPELTDAETEARVRAWFLHVTP